MARKHPIIALLTERVKTQQWLVARIRSQGSKLSEAQLSRIINGKQGVTREQAHAISKALGGKVRPEAIFLWSPAVRRAAA